MQTCTQNYHDLQWTVTSYPQLLHDTLLKTLLSDDAMKTKTKQKAKERVIANVTTRKKYMYRQLLHVQQDRQLTSWSGQGRPFQLKLKLFAGRHASRSSDLWCSKSLVEGCQHTTIHLGIPNALVLEVGGKTKLLVCPPLEIWWIIISHATLPFFFHHSFSGHGLAMQCT